MKEIKFKSFSSGSAGNCYFIAIIGEDGKLETSILIDAGVSIRMLKKELGADGYRIEDICAVLVTHDHMDHIRSLGSYSKHLKLPVWATERLHYALAHHFTTHEHVPSCKRVLSDNDWTWIIPDKIRCRYFIVPHDATQTAGFELDIDGLRYVHVTDCGRVTPEMIEAAKRAHTVTLESNYDRQMLINGPYPAELKERIKGGHGHLSNDECADALKEIWHDGLRNIFLCHVSDNNNTPQLAYDSAKAALDSCAGHESCRLQVLPRQAPIKTLTLNA